jgi:hypothetical protein
MGIRSFIVATTVVALALAPTAARASASYPGLIQQDLGPPTCVPACTICHRDLNGGTGSVTTPFGRALMGLGLVGASPAALKGVLDKENATNADSNSDGVSDIDALMACRDPNLVYVGDGGVTADGAAGAGAGPGFTDPTPEYGCATGRVSHGQGEALAAVAGALLMVTRRRRRRRVQLG